MGYNELFNAAHKAGHVKEIVPIIQEWTSPGQYLIGRLVGIDEVPGGAGKPPFKKYTLETDAGLMSCTLGVKQDGMLNEDHFGRIMMFTFVSKNKTANGHTANNFSIQVADISPKDLKEAFPNESNE